MFAGSPSACAEVPGDASLAADIMEHVNAAVVVHDTSGRILMGNEAACVLLGVGRDELVGRALTDDRWRALGPDGQPISAARHPAAAALLAGHPSGGFDMAVRRPTGQLRWLHVVGREIAEQPGTVATTIVDVTDERAMARAYAISQETHDILVRSSSVAELAHELCRVVVECGDHVLTWVARARDDAERSVETICSVGATDYLYDGMVSWDASDPRGLGPVGIALREASAALVVDVASDERFIPWRDRARRFGVSSVVAIPFRMGDRPAALTVYAGQPAAFNELSLGVLTRLGRNLEYGIENLDRVERMRTSLESTVRTIASMNEIRDLYTSGHQRRVARLAVAIGSTLGLDESALTSLRLGALVHDVGKIAVPAEILSKPGRLHRAEWELMRRHAEIGQRLLESGALPAPVPQIAGQHHERLDGSGYPFGLRGDEICHAARIVAVADVVEAVTHHRPYRAALGLGVALDIVSAAAGTGLDADAVRACQAVLASGYAFDDEPDEPWLLTD